MAWLQQPVVAKSYFQKCPSGRAELEVSCLPDSYIPDDATFHQVMPLPDFHISRRLF